MARDKKPLESKKFLLATFAIGIATFVWVATFLGVILCPVAAAHLVTLATLLTTLMGAVAGAGITGQSFVDWRAQATMQSSTETRREDVNIHEERLFRVEKLDPKDLDNLTDDD